MRGSRRGIRNDKPIISDYGVNSSGSGDMYPKGGNMLHTIRQLINDDDKWREILRGLNHEFYHQTVSTNQVEAYMSEKSAIDLSKVFDQHLRDSRIPILEYQIKRNSLEYRWSNVIDGFDMPIEVTVGGSIIKLQPGSGWQKIKVKSSKGGLKVNPDYYIASLNVSGK